MMIALKHFSHKPKASFPGVATVLRLICIDSLPRKQNPL